MLEMASAALLENPSEQLKCPVCQGKCDKPARLDCGHSFCSDCIVKYFELQERQFCCPACSRVFHFPRKVLLVMLKNKFKSGLTDNTTDAVAIPPPPPPPATCDLHWLPLNLFCKTDKKALCLICTTLPEHSSHRIKTLKNPVEQGEKIEIHDIIRLSRKKKVSGAKRCTEYEKMIKSTMKDLESTKQKIAEEFQALHTLLYVEQAHLEMKLDQEEETIIKSLENKVIDITDEIIWTKKAEKEIKISKNLHKLGDSVIANIIDIITDCESQLNRQKDILRKQTSDVVSCGPFPYIAWSKMKHIIKPIPVALSLDRDTAHPYLVLSKDLKRVKLGYQCQDVPQNPKRFEKCLYVLGSEGFQSGRCYWEVDVGCKTNWTVGVVKESISRQTEEQMAPENGYWVLRRISVNEYYVLTSPPALLNLKFNPSRIGIYLNFEGGQVSFYSAVNMFHIFTFVDSFDQKIFPFFCPGLIMDEEKDWESLRLCY